MQEANFIFILSVLAAEGEALETLVRNFTIKLKFFSLSKDQHSIFSPFSHLWIKRISSLIIKQPNTLNECTKNARKIPELNQNLIIWQKPNLITGLGRTKSKKLPRLKRGKTPKEFYQRHKTQKTLN